MAVTPLVASIQNHNTGQEKLMTDKNRTSSRTQTIALVSFTGILIVLCTVFLLFEIIKKLSVFIEPDERGVVLTYYQPTEEILEPGYHFIMPGNQFVVFDIGRQIYATNANPDEQPDFIEGITKDGQKIQVDISVIYAVNSEQVINLYKAWQDRYRDELVRPMCRSITRDALEQYTFDEIMEKRDEIGDVISSQLETAFGEQYLIFMKFDLIDVRHANE
jgi:regulator of protease activity HflC (stomatin/prohibitin superfamily)